MWPVCSGPLPQAKGRFRFNAAGSPQQQADWVTGCLSKATFHALRRHLKAGRQTKRLELGGGRGGGVTGRRCDDAEAEAEAHPTRRAHIHLLVLHTSWMHLWLSEDAHSAGDVVSDGSRHR